MSNKKIEIDMTGCLRKRFSVFVCGVCEGGRVPMNLLWLKTSLKFLLVKLFIKNTLRIGLTKVFGYNKDKNFFWSVTR